MQSSQDLQVWRSLIPNMHTGSTKTNSLPAPSQSGNHPAIAGQGPCFPGPSGLLLAHSCPSPSGTLSHKKMTMLPGSGTGTQWMSLCLKVGPKLQRHRPSQLLEGTGVSLARESWSSSAPGNTSLRKAACGHRCWQPPAKLREFISL